MNDVKDQNVYINILFVCFLAGKGKIPRTNTGPKDGINEQVKPIQYDSDNLSFGLTGAYATLLCTPCIKFMSDRE